MRRDTLHRHPRREVTAWSGRDQKVTYNSSNASSKGQTPEETLDAAMSTVGSCTNGSTDDDE